jgi:hypothetical protein
MTTFAEPADTIDAEFTVTTTKTEPLVVIDAALESPSFDASKLTDDAVIELYASIDEEITRVLGMLRGRSVSLKSELERRMIDRKAKEIAHPLLETCQLVPQFTDYRDDLDAAREAKKLLLAAGKDEDAAKVLKTWPAQFIPAHTKPAYDERGNRNSITSLCSRYGIGTPIGDALHAIQKRDSLGEILSIKVRKGGA